MSVGLSLGNQNLQSALAGVYTLYPKCNTKLVLTRTKNGYTIPLICYLCMRGYTNRPMDIRADCIAKCTDIETAQIGRIL